MKYRLLYSFTIVFLITGINCDCSVPQGMTCLERYFNRTNLCREGNSHNPNITSNTTLPSYLYVDPNTTYLGYNGHLSATINKTLAPNSSYVFLFCYIRTFFGLPFPWYINCLEDNVTSVSTTFKWNVLGEVTLYLFTSDDTGTRNGCDYATERIQNCSNTLQVHVRLRQNEVESTSFKVGTINIAVKVKTTSSIHSYMNPISNGCPNDSHTNIGYSGESASGSAASEGGGGSGGGGSDKSEDTLYDYKFYFPDGSYENHTVSNKTKLSLDHNFTTETNSSIFVEVLSDTGNEIRYGSATVNIIVYEPVTNPQVTVNGKYIGERVPVSVEAQGSTPIGVEWSLYFNGSTMQCEQNATILNSAQSDTFYCTFNNSGDYNINVTFKNTVSYESANKPFTMSQPPPINVVATSTSAVAVLIVLLVVVIICVVLIGSYISYRKFRNKSTEIADFSFVDLDEPSRWQRLTTQANKIRERFGKRKKFGLVNPGENETLDSFYGSLNPFAAHESL